MLYSIYTEQSVFPLWN